METITFEKDIHVFYITASSFPAGIMAAHNLLHVLAPLPPERKFFGLSRPENGGAIVYKAAAEELVPGEAEKLNCEALTIKKGKYLCMTLNDYEKNPMDISRAFEKLLQQPDLDPNGYCVEWYVNATDVQCMIRLSE